MAKSLVSEPRHGKIHRDRESFERLLEPVRQSLRDVKHCYRDSLLSTSYSEISDEILLPGQPQERIARAIGHESIRDIAEYMQGLQGKWFRPAVLLLSADLFGPISPGAISVAAALELIHNATLIHDDIIDEAETRRGHRAVWKRCGSSATVLMGDLLYAKAFELTTAHGDIRIQRVIAQATSRMCQGELHQLQWAGDVTTTEAEYLQVICDKTARLMAACAQCGGMLAGAAEEGVDRLRRFGLHLGMAFQIADDVLDYVADPKQLGKSVGNDVAHGKVTLPLIHHLAHGNEPESALAAIRGDNGRKTEDLTEALRSTGSIDYALQVARKYAERAKVCLDELEPFGAETRKIDHLKRLADFVVHRRY